MTAILKISTICLTATLALASNVLAQTKDPLDGTWRLNVAKSKMTGGGASSSETIVFKVTATEESFESNAVQASDGAREHTGYKATYGGPAAPMASIYVAKDGSISRVDTGMVAVIKISDRIRERQVTGRDGRVGLHARREISADGKTLNASILTKDASGKEVVSQTRVFDRVE